MRSENPPVDLAKPVVGLDEVLPRRSVSARLARSAVNVFVTNKKGGDLSITALEF
jgi:hypothetical protein